MATRELSAPISRSMSSVALDDVWHPKRGVRWGPILRHAILILFCAVVLLPLFWILLMSFKSIPDGVRRYIWPQNFIKPFFAHYQWVWEKRPDVKQNFKNSVEVTIGTVILSTVTAVLAGYALVHLRTPGQKVIVLFLVASTFFPTRVTALIGIYNVQNRLGLINHTWGLMLPYTALSTAISIFIMRGIFETIPKDIFDSSRIDGASSFRTLLGIMLPLVINGIVVVVIVNFVAAWGEYLLAQTLMNDSARKTLPVFIANAGGGLGAWFWPRLAALYILAITPGLVVFGLAQRWYMKGLQEGALKT
jgi:ABC-type glycerol-3-phosphate transport system permease component